MKFNRNNHSGILQEFNKVSQKLSKLPLELDSDTLDRLLK